MHRLKRKASTLRPEQSDRIVEFHLEGAIWDVLLEAKHEGDCIGAAEISRRAGIFGERGKENIMNDAIAVGILVKLRDQGQVQRCKQERAGSGGSAICGEEKGRVYRGCRNRS